MSGEQCSWCGVVISAEDGYRAVESPGERVAAFCRLEHVVPWVMQGTHWDAGVPQEPLAEDASLERCAMCDAALDDVRVVLVHHRGEHRIADAFCGAAHLRDWAQAGGRWR